MNTSKPSLVVTACVCHYIAENAIGNATSEAGDPADTFTATDIVAHYGLDAGTYDYQLTGRHIAVAEQLVRNELNVAFREGDVVRLNGPRDLPLKRGRQWVYVAAGSIAREKSVTWAELHE